MREDLQYMIELTGASLDLSKAAQIRGNAEAARNIQKLVTDIMLILHIWNARNCPHGDMILGNEDPMTSLRSIYLKLNGLDEEAVAETCKRLECAAQGWGYESFKTLDPDDRFDLMVSLYNATREDVRDLPSFRALFEADPQRRMLAGLIMECRDDHDAFFRRIPY